MCTQMKARLILLDGAFVIITDVTSYITSSPDPPPPVGAPSVGAAHPPSLPPRPPRRCVLAAERAQLDVEVRMLTRAQTDLRQELSASENQRRLADVAAAEAKAQLELVGTQARQAGEEARSKLRTSGAPSWLNMMCVNGSGR